MSTSGGPRSNANNVICMGDGLKFGYLNHPIYATVDTKKAGPGELTVFCSGPERNAFCELRDHRDGTFTLIVRAQDVGIHELCIKYDDIDVRGSPFELWVSPASLVKVSGPGLNDGLISQHKGEFIINTKDAGPGEVKIKIGGPRGAFKMQNAKDPNGHEVICKYSPREPGIYVINVTWSGDHLPGSPYQVFLCKTEEQLKRYLQVQSGKERVHGHDHSHDHPTIQ